MLKALILLATAPSFIEVCCYFETFWFPSCWWKKFNLDMHVFFRLVSDMDCRLSNTSDVWPKQTGWSRWNSFNSWWNSSPWQSRNQTMPTWLRGNWRVFSFDLFERRYIFPIFGQLYVRFQCNTGVNQYQFKSRRSSQCATMWQFTIQVPWWFLY